MKALIQTFQRSAFALSNYEFFANNRQEITYGAFVEFSRAQANARHLKIKEGQSYRIEDPRYAEHVKYLWLTADDNSDVKVYDQKRLVEYADYKPGMLYVSVYEVFPAGEGH